MSFFALKFFINYYAYSPPHYTFIFWFSPKDKLFIVRVCAQSLQSYLILCGPMDSNTLGSTVHGSFQPRILGWVAISYSRGSSWPRDQAHVSWVSCTAGRFFTTSATMFSPKDKLCVRNIVFNLIELHLNLVNMWVWGMVFYYYIHYFFSGYCRSDFSV